MPVRRVDDVGTSLLRLGDLGVDERHHDLSPAHVQVAAGVGEVVLHVDHDERGLRIVRDAMHDLSDDTQGL